MVCVYINIIVWYLYDRNNNLNSLFDLSLNTHSKIKYVQLTHRESQQQYDVSLNCE